jgi:hypothetical protein
MMTRQWLRFCGVVRAVLLNLLGWRAELEPDVIREKAKEVTVVGDNLAS